MQSESDSSHESEGVPRLAPDWNWSSFQPSATEGFLLSRIDGLTPWAQLRLIGGIPPEEVDRRLREWLVEGVLVLAKSEKSGSSEANGAPPEAVEIEPWIDLPEEFQRRVLDFEKTLHKSYHHLLGVPRKADSRDIKRAYFKLSKEFHPDRYYRRELGSYKQRLETIFTKVVEAYELLSDPATRAEIERSMEPEPPAVESEEESPSIPEAPETPAARKLAALERLRAHFRIPDEILQERKFKARQFFQAAMIAGKKGKWQEAAASVRLAIAFDPWNEEYKSGFANVQAQVHQMRAAELLERADASWDASAQQEAMRLYEEALSYRPGDPKINQRAAALALEMHDLDLALEYAEAACQFAPDVAEFHVLRGQILRRAGLSEKAGEAFEEACRVDPHDAAAASELEMLTRRKKSKGGGSR